MLPQVDPTGSQTHVPFRQALLFPAQSELARQPGAQVKLAVQYAPSGQSACRVHSTQLFVWVSQTGVAPPHWPSRVHSTQVWVWSLQTGVAPPQWLFWLHSTQMPLPTSPKQIGVVPPQAAPVGSQTHE